MWGLISDVDCGGKQAMTCSECVRNGADCAGDCVMQHGKCIIQPVLSSMNNNTVYD